MRHNGKGNPLTVFVACVTLGWLPTILLVMGIVWIVQAIPVWVWLLVVFLGFMLFIHKGIQGEKSNEN